MERATDQVPSDAAPGPLPTSPADNVFSPGRAFVGLALLGWGLSILVGASPHEDILVGGGLTLFGFALVGTAPSLPHVKRMSSYVVGGLGAALAVGLLSYMAWSHSPLDVPKGAMVVLGLALVAVAPFLTRSVTLPLRRRPKTTVASLVLCAATALGAPLVAWGVQAMFKSAAGATPVEAFVRYGLILPLHGFLAILGMQPVTNGQIITYTTPRGPLSLEVGAACSGVQAMALFAAVLALFLFVHRPKGGRLAMWSAIGLGGVYVANLLRLGALALVGQAWGPEALVRAHAEAGWMFFVAWAVLFAWMASRQPAKTKVSS